MKFLVAVMLAAAGCTMTTAARPGTDAANAWLQSRASRSVEVVGTGARDRTSVVIEAPTPTELRFRTRDALVIPVEQIHTVVEVRRGLTTLEGAGLGVAAGVLLGLVYGATRRLDSYEQSMDCTIVCNHDESAKLGALEFGVLGLLLGAATGAVVGHRDVLDLR